MENPSPAPSVADVVRTTHRCDKKIIYAKECHILLKARLRLGSSNQTIHADWCFMFAQEIFATNAASDSPRDDHAEKQKIALIASFETAIDHGLSPQLAIAAILEWVADECARLSEN